MQYVIPVKVLSVENRRRLLRSYRKNAFDSNSEIIQDFENLGWFLHLEGSFESICLGEEEPSFKAGDLIEVVLRKRV